MLIIDDNDLRLLKMKEKLLEISVDVDLQSVLDDYKKIAIEIDKKVYDSIIDRIKNSEYHNQSFEEQLAFLSELESEYDRLNELQHRFRNTYEKHSDGGLELSNLENIFIDVIKERISNISGYLINIKNIDVSEKKLEELSEKLISEEQKKQSNGVRLRELDFDLRDNALKVEGRIYTSMGDIEYTSVVSEYKSLGLDLEGLLSDGELLGNKLKEFEEKSHEQDNALKVAEISYNSMSNDSYRDVYENIKRDAIRARYELSLLKIARLLYRITDEYDMAREKREQLSDLIKYRVSCLNSLGVKFSIDPFSRIRVNEQLDIINAIKDNTKDIVRIRREIFNLNSDIEEMKDRNENLLSKIHTDESLIMDDFSISSVDISEVSIDEVEPSFVPKEIKSNQVISVSELSNGFLFNRVLEKTQGVIRRVNEMTNRVPVKSEVEAEPFEVAPEIVIESSAVLPEIKNIKNEEEFTEFEEPQFEAPQFEEDVEEGLAGLPKDIVEGTEIDLFQEVEPFEAIPLFKDRYENSSDTEPIPSDSTETIKEITDLKFDKSEIDFGYEPSVNDRDDNGNDSLIQELPDAFWVTQDDTTEEENTEIIDDDSEYPDFMYFDDEPDDDKKNVKVRSLAA